MANEKDKTTKADIKAQEMINVLVTALQHEDNYNKFVGGRVTGGVQFVEVLDGTSRVVIDLAPRSE